MNWDEDFQSEHQKQVRAFVTSIHTNILKPEELAVVEQAHITDDDIAWMMTLIKQQWTKEQMLDLIVSGLVYRSGMNRHPIIQNTAKFFRTELNKHGTVTGIAHALITVENLRKQPDVTQDWIWNPS